MAVLKNSQALDIDEESDRQVPAQTTGYIVNLSG